MARFTFLLTFVALLTLLAPAAVGAVAAAAPESVDSAGGITAFGQDNPCC